MPSNLPLASLVAFALFQAAWFGTAFLAAHRPELAAAPMVAYLVLHLAAWSRARMATLVLCACALACGWVVDSALSASGALAFADGAQTTAWMLALWAAFAPTLETSLANVARRPLVALVLGAVAGPLAYRGGAALGALTVAPDGDTVRALALIGVAWAIALPTLGFVATRLTIERYARRARTLPRLALITAVTLAGAPVWLALACVVDLVRGKRSLPSARVVAFGIAFVCIECVVLARTLADTLVLRGAALIDATYARQQQFTRAILTAVERIFRIRVVVEGDACVTPGPVIVLARHASIVDTVLPNVIVTQQRGVRLRFVLKRELLEDPCLDVAGTRLPNHFVSRTSETQTADLVAIEQLAHGLGANEGVLIYPEGTRFTEEKARRAREESGSTLTHTLPAKPGGTLAALRGAPTADVVFVAHRGLDGFAHVKDIWSGALLDRVVNVRLWRVARADIPVDDDARKRWLAAAWARVDREVAEMPA